MYSILTDKKCSAKHMLAFLSRTKRLSSLKNRGHFVISIKIAYRIVPPELSAHQLNFTGSIQLKNFDVLKTTTPATSTAIQIRDEQKSEKLFIGAALVSEKTPTLNVVEIRPPSTEQKKAQITATEDVTFKPSPQDPILLAAK